MFELVARMVICVALLAFSAATGQPDIEFAATAGAVFALLSGGVYLAEQRGWRNEGIAGFIAVGDALFLSFVLARMDETGRFGFVTILPMVWATRQFRSNSAFMSPLVASSLLVATNLMGGNAFAIPTLAQAAAVLLVGLILQPKEAEAPAAQPAVVETVTKVVVEPPAEYLEFRENFRQLKDHAGHVERRSRRDRTSVMLYEAVLGAAEHPFVALAKRLADATGAKGVTLYCTSDFGNKMVVQAVQGDVPERVEDAAFDVPQGLGDAQMRHRIEKLLLTLRNPDQPVQAGTILLKVKGRLVGMVGLFHPAVKALEEAVERAQEAAEAIASLVQLILEREEDRRRLRETDLLYAVAATSSGADSAASVAARVVRELGAGLRVDGVAVAMVDGEESVTVASNGQVPTVLDLMSFAQGPGVKGWLLTGAPELALLDALDDQRLPKAEAIKRRIGSYVVIPIQFGSVPFGYLAASTTRVGGIDKSKLETLRVVAAELSQAIARLENTNRDPEGLTTPKEFQKLVGQSSGCLVYLEVLRREELAETYGRPAVDFATRKFAARVRAMLPPAGIICRRDEGDYVAFLRDADESFARRWANDAAASASLIGLTTPDGRAKLPLAMRSKVAVLDQQIHQISQEKVAS